MERKLGNGWPCAQLKKIPGFSCYRERETRNQGQPVSSTTLPQVLPPIQRRIFKLILRQNFPHNFPSQDWWWIKSAPLCLDFQGSLITLRSKPSSNLISFIKSQAAPIWSLHSLHSQWDSLALDCSLLFCMCVFSKKLILLHIFSCEYLLFRAPYLSIYSQGFFIPFH